MNNKTKDVLSHRIIETFSIIVVFISLIIAMLATSGCDKDDIWVKDEVLIIGSHKVYFYYTPVFAGLGYAAKRNADDKEWERFGYCIDGFDYEPGYEYEIAVKHFSTEYDPMIPDRITDTYYLKSVISKNRKESENMPDMYPPHWPRPKE